MTHNFIMYGLVLLLGFFLGLLYTKAKSIHFVNTLIEVSKKNEKRTVEKDDDIEIIERRIEEITDGYYGEMRKKMDNDAELKELYSQLIHNPNFKIEIELDEDDINELMR